MKELPFWYTSSIQDNTVVKQKHNLYSVLVATKNPLSDHYGI